MQRLRIEELAKEHTQLLTENTEMLHFIQDNVVIREEFQKGVDKLEGKMGGLKIEFSRLEKKVDEIRMQSDPLFGLISAKQKEKLDQIKESYLKNKPKVKNVLRINKSN